MADHAGRVLEWVSRPDYEPVTLKALSRRLEIAVDDYADFRSAVKGLVREGKLDVSRDRKLRKPDVKGLMIGTYRRSSRGFGFVRPLKQADRSKDVYIPADAGLDASSGDQVAVQITKRP